MLLSSSRWGGALSGLSQGQLGQGLFSSQAVEQSVHVRVRQSHSPVQSAVPALYLVVSADTRIEYIPHSYRELAIKPCRCKVSNKLLDGGVVRHQRLISECGVGWPDSYHGQEWQCHHPLDESETTIENISANLQTTWRNTTNGSCQPTNNMEKYNKWIVPTYEQRHGEIQQMHRVNLRTTYNVIPRDSCVDTLTVRLLQPQGLHLPPQSLCVVKEASLMARVGKLQPNRSIEA